MISDTLKKIAENKLGEGELYKLAVDALKNGRLTAEEKEFFNEIKLSTRHAVVLGHSMGIDYNLLQRDAKSLLETATVISDRLAMQKLKG